MLSRPQTQRKSILGLPNLIPLVYRLDCHIFIPAVLVHLSSDSIHYVNRNLLQVIAISHLRLV